jgi:hypothetical protein
LCLCTCEVWRFQETPRVHHSHQISAQGPPNSQKLNTKAAIQASNSPLVHHSHVLLGILGRLGLRRKLLSHVTPEGKKGKVSGFFAGSVQS